MSKQLPSRKLYLTAGLRKLYVTCFVLFGLSHAIWAQAAPTAAEVEAETLISRLKSASEADAPLIERDIKRIWSKSGSASADLLLKRGLDALKAGKIDAAIEHLTALTDHAPDFAEGWHARASAYYRAGLYGPALEDLAQALRLNPNHFDAIQGLGAVFEQLGDPKRAWEAYSQVLAIHPHHAEVLEAMERIEPKVKGPAL